jgi:hypothetical protein
MRVCGMMYVDVWLVIGRAKTCQGLSRCLVRFVVVWASVLKMKSCSWLAGG